MAVSVSKGASTNKNGQCSHSQGERERYQGKFVAVDRLQGTARRQ